MDGIKERTPTYLPHDIIEIILSRLPVKSLLRFKCVCKQWKTTISHPKFAQTHLRLSIKSSSSLLEEYSPLRAQLVDLENEFRRFSAVDYPPLNTPSERSLPSHCDGLYVFSYLVGEYGLRRSDCPDLKKGGSGQGVPANKAT